MPETVVRHETRDIGKEIDEFESTLRKIHGRQETQPIPQAIPQRLTGDQLKEIKDGFFDEFEQFMHREDFASEGVLDQDIVWKMKEFHKRRQEGKEYYIYSKDVQQAIDRRLAELKDLEREWFMLREETDETERRMAGVESEIQARS